MEIRPRVIQAELMESLREIERQVEEVKREARDMGIPPEKLRLSNGNWAMIPLVVSKVEVLHALTLLNTKEN